IKVHIPLLHQSLCLRRRCSAVLLSCNRIPILIWPCPSCCYNHWECQSRLSIHLHHALSTPLRALDLPPTDRLVWPSAGIAPIPLTCYVDNDRPLSTVPHQARICYMMLHDATS